MNRSVHFYLAGNEASLQRLYVGGSPKMCTVESGDSLEDGKEIKLNEDQLNDLSEVQMRDYE